MNKALAIGLLACLVVSGCAGSGGTTPVITPFPASTLQLNPSPLELTSDHPAAVVTAQGDVAGVQYTPHAAGTCIGTSGSVAVAGDGIAQLDVADSPLMFIVVATGTPPASCEMTVAGSDGSFATVPISYSTITITQDLMNRANVVQQVVANDATFSPSSVTISAPTDVVEVSASGFNGTTKSSVSCSGTSAGIGISVIPSSFNGSGTIVIAPYGQGALSGSCIVTFTDATSARTALTVTLAAAALPKLTVSPANVQFSCAGSSPQTCTTSSVTIAESGATQFKINNHPTLVNSCANVFNGPLMMASGNGTYAPYVAGPQAKVSFYGLLPSSSLNCKKIYIGDGGSQTVVVSVNQQIASGGTAVTAASCTGPDPLAAVPNAPHGIYVWNPYREGNVEPQIEQYVLGPGTTPLDPDICGASIVIPWADVETSKGTYDYSQINTWVRPYVKVGLRVNLLFEDTSEECCTDTGTPSWVFTQDNVPQVNCPGQPPYPNWLNATYEADWEQFADAMIAHFSTGGGAAYAANVGYMRFAIGAGVESYPGHIESAGTTPHPCLDAWAQASPAFSESAWLLHSLNIVRNLKNQTTDKQLMVSLNYVSTYDASNPNDTYTYTNAVAAVAAPNGIAMGVQNLGISANGTPVAGANVAPRPCDPTKQYVDIYWCQAYMRHNGVVPLEFQPIVSPVAPGSYDITIAHIFQYGLDNNAQIFEIYPQDWVFKDDPAQYPSFTAATQAEYTAAFDTTSLILGRNH